MKPSRFAPFAATATALLATAAALLATVAACDDPALSGPPPATAGNSPNATSASVAASASAATAPPPPANVTSAPTPAPTPSGQSGASATSAKMTPQQLEARYERCTGFINAKDRNNLASCFTSDAVGGIADMPPAHGGAAIVIKFYSETWEAFPDFTAENELVLVNGSHLAAFVLDRGTQTAAFKGMGIPATGKKIGLIGLHFIDFDAQGKMTLDMDAVDPSTIAGQLGVSPAPHRDVMSSGWQTRPVVIATGSQTEIDNVALVKSLGALFYGKKLDEYLSHFADDSVMHDMSAPADMKSKDSRPILTGLAAAFPDMTGTPAITWGAGDYVVDVTHWQATNTGDAPMMGLKKTGKHVELTEFQVYRIQNGKVAELWMFRNGMAMMQQLGMLGGH